MARLIALDASVLIAALDARDAHHHRAASLMRTHVATGFAMHSLTVAESLVGAVRHNQGDRVHADLAGLNVRTAVFDDREPLQLAGLRVRTGLRLPDCCVLLTALQSLHGLATFDDSLAAAARKLGIALIG